ncbi:hypothetical protein QBC42DRAFT_268863 [Cladorrhinum samala]|uniref:Uncharacterized protein n=1 Tax=Cladorrhinum samala TaxID=585594 RepID=A0AAV9HQU6_9PEZI|nr:hypothetical protein QBC42DRAFT_268863 [Cladorrhinum samala]
MLLKPPASRPFKLQGFNIETITDTLHITLVPLVSFPISLIPKTALILFTPRKNHSIHAQLCIVFFILSFLFILFSFFLLP